ncbi:uncharacterized protein BJ212DRAFT_1549409 [Suillus subaureus]|uniref:Uncharacterized protein n=1 Tax=Suillus subaureus TaxID=48587 RepID=A0A9P7AJH1_9AGAM|nr:uncharacterized protein BJ212DRAFT_1549409 [Suillus subaureus]KAG1790738.1 hypothetical protein BJ212DRAFT_1549409 [Suillus subaureus]
MARSRSLSVRAVGTLGHRGIFLLDRAFCSTLVESIQCVYLVGFYRIGVTLVMHHGSNIVLAVGCLQYAACIKILYK